MVERYIPLEIRRRLRRESYFGCAKCGSPIIEYHHILPFAEKFHHNPEDMIALCPTCHRSMGKMKRERSYALKQNPFNLKNGKIRGELSDRDISAYFVGSCTYIDTPVFFSFYEAPIIIYRVSEGRFLLSAYIPRPDMWPDILIEDNDLMVNLDDKWDVEFRTDYLCIKRSESSTFFMIDLRKDVAKIEGRIQILGNTYEFTPEKTNFGGLTIMDATIKNCGAGIAIGDGKRKLLWPNYAMNTPSALLVPKT